MAGFRRREDMSDLDITFPSIYTAMPRLKCQYCEDTFFLDLDKRRHEKGHMSINDSGSEQMEKVLFKGGATSTKIPGFKYIPRVALERLARRFELGLERHKEHSWNALNPNSAMMLDDKDWLIERLSHVIHHCYKEIEYIVSKDPPNIEGRDDNAAAIMWGGACLIAADERRKKIYEMGLKTTPKD